MTVDHGRAAVYAAEDAAFGGTDLDDERSLADLVATGAALAAGAWWRDAGGPAVRVGQTVAGATSSCARSDGATVEVRIAPEQRTRSTLAHELAHALAGLAHGHDATFRAAHVDVCAILAGRDAAAALRVAYSHLDLVVGRRRWPAPVRAVGDGFAVVP